MSDDEVTWASGSTEPGRGFDLSALRREDITIRPLTADEFSREVQGELWRGWFDQIGVTPGPGAGTWTCMVCGDERPDALISVAHRALALAEPWPYPDSPPPTVNVRYCNDRPACAATAQADGPWDLGGALT